MKFFSPCARVLVLASILPSLSHGQTTDAAKRETYILGSVADGKESPATYKNPEKLRSADSRILGTITKHQNGRKVTIHQVEPPAPLPIQRIKIPATEVAPEDNLALRNTPAVRPMEHIGVSSTIYGTGEEKRTRLTLHYKNKDYHAWSNIDYRHFRGFAAYKANGRDYFFLLGAGLARDARGNVMEIKDAYKAGCPRSFAPTNGQADFTLLDSNEEVDQEALAKAREILNDMHDLYRTEKTRLVTAHESRLALAPINARRAKERREAPPKDITIRFWKRDMEQEQAALQQHAAQEGESK